MNPGERQIQHFAQRAHHQSLAETGHTLEKTVAATYQRQKHLLDQFLVADDGAPELRAQIAKTPARRFDPVLDRICVVHIRLSSS